MMSVTSDIADISKWNVAVYLLRDTSVHGAQRGVPINPLSVHTVLRLVLNEKQLNRKASTIHVLR